jgi:FkbM family methyltransferase
MLCHKITPPGSNDLDTLKLKDILKKTFNNNKFLICQIGANDGISADPIYDFIKENINVEAHLIEPQLEAFQLLKKNYQDIIDQKRIYFYNYAISNKNEKIKLYKNTAENGTDGHSSLLIRDLDIVNGIEVAKYTENDYELVDSLTVKKLKNKIKKNIDVLVIDTEGYDIEIVKMFINSNIYPKVIYFEKPGITGNIPGEEILLSTSAEKYIYEKLEENNYIIEKLEDNWICIKR